MKGEDLEFRITQYPVRMLNDVVLENLVFPTSLTFKECQFEKLTFINCKFLQNQSFKECNLKSLRLIDCEIKDFQIEQSVIKNLEIKSAKSIDKLHIGSSDIDSLSICENKAFESIEVACENNIVTALFEGNGDSVRNSFKSTIYLCPEHFDKIVLKNNTSEILHIGTIGKYSALEIEDYTANLVLFSNCNSSSSKVSFQNLQPIDPFLASVCIVNSDTIVKMKHEGAFDLFREVKRYNQTSLSSSELRTMAS